MADNPSPQPPQQPPKVLPPLQQSSGLTGKLKSPTTQLPSSKITGSGKIVVMLSSVAKSPGSTQSIPIVAPPLKAPPNLAKSTSAQLMRQPAPMLPKQVKLAAPIKTDADKLSSTTFVQLPQKTTSPGWTPTVTKPMTSDKAAVPPLLPPKRPDTTGPVKKSGAQHIPAIKLNEPSAETNTPADSLLQPAAAPLKPEAKSDAKPEGWKSLEKGELTPPPGGIEKLDAFARSQKLAENPTIADLKPAPSPVVPPMLPTEKPDEPKPTLNAAPVSLPSSHPVPPSLPSQSSHPVQHAPPMKESETQPEPPAEKLPQPHLPVESKKSEDAPLEIAALKVSALIPSETPSAAPPKHLPPPLLPESKPAEAKPVELKAVEPKPDDLKKKSAPIVVSSTSPKTPAVAENKPALKPAVLPKRALPLPKESDVEIPPILPVARPEAKKPDEVAKPAPIAKASSTVEDMKRTSSVRIDFTKAAKAEDKKKEVAAVASVAAGTTAKSISEGTGQQTSESVAKPLPLTRAERARKRRSLIGPIIGLLFVLAIGLGILFFGGHSQEEAQVAPASASSHGTWLYVVGGAVALVLALGAMLKFKSGITKVELTPALVPSSETKKPALPLTRTERAKKRRMAGTLIFWLVMVPITGIALVMGSFYFGRDTRVEGQVIPPQGMTVNNEVWVVSDFRELASGIAEDLAAERTPIMQEIQERREHVQRIQADIGAREERIRLIQDEIQAAKDEMTSLVKKSRDETQAIWDGEGAAIDGDYQSKLSQLKHAIADRAKTLNLKYEPDETYQSPEVWANAFRLALYQVPAGVDAVKEHQWLGDQMKQWRDFQKSLDDRKEQLREKAAAKKLEPAQKITDLNAKIDDLNQRIDATNAEEVPLKGELQQAQTELAQAQTADQGLDEKYYKQLYSLPVENITYHIPVAPNGRFTWVQDEAFSAGETARKYWIFSRATRADGRQYWALGRISIEKNHKLCLTMDPENFISTKAILRPNLPPEEMDQ